MPSLNAGFWIIDSTVLKGAEFLNIYNQICMHGFLFRPIHQSFWSEVRYVTVGLQKRKEKNRDTKLWRSSFGDHGNNALPLSIPELDLIGGVARGLAEGRSVLARSKPGYVKRYEIYKQLCSWTLLKSLIIKIINLIVWVYSINSCQKWNRIRNIFQLHCNTIEREWGTKQY